MNVASFAAGFAEQLADAWDKGPHVFRDVLTASLFTPREFMEAILGTAEDYFADPDKRCRAASAWPAKR